jgi:hypothetical protein
MTRQALFAVAMVLAMVGAPLTGAVAAADSTGNDTTLSVGVTQDDDEVAVSVTRNDTGVANASVLVEPVDNDTYAGTGEYATGDDGEVELPAPAENLSVDVTAEADNETATTTAGLVAVEENETDDNGTDSFGKRVSAYILALHNDQNVTRIGPYVAAFVTAENPGNAPDHAGPPAFVLDGDDDNETEDRGPPAHAGPPEDRGDGAEVNGTGDNETDDRGPPAHAGPPEDRGDDADEEDEDDESDDSETDTEEAETEETDADGEDGPPDDAGPPDRGDS